MNTQRHLSVRPRPAQPDMQAPVRAILGPTNTGKTHLALERMLAHPSGIMGFPLRLLARENYERMVKLKGVRHVALITGEEKIIPPGARWFSCTTEAMPLDRPVSFIAIDEIQLCADPERGHIFTDRLLNARGQEETLFLGAETIAPLLRSLVRHIEIETRPRLSNLSCTGFTRLSRLPPRTAIVAFSAGDVYAIAEMIRRRRGGCAIVMGQLSPRTRNAQVALYQNREVDYLVATDAIGMGLNMDIHHVAFAGLSKFDGSGRRFLSAPEIAQIAGRAGRGTLDGTFGTTGDCPPLSENITEAVETHQFEPLHHLYWRNSSLDYSSPDALHASLCRKTPAAGLWSAPPASDLLTLIALMRDTTIQNLCQAPRHVQLLWDVCQIPDFRKLGEDSHIRQCAQIFVTLRRKGRLPSDWLETRLVNLERTEGDIEDLMHRLMGIRLWAYVANHIDWVEKPEHWRARTRTVEDALSDLLHERLAARFVDKRATSLARRLEEADSAPLLSAITRTGEVSVEGHPLGRMHGFHFVPDADVSAPDQKLLLRAARRAVRSEIPRRVAQFLQTEDEALTFDLSTGALLWQGDHIASLQAGETLFRPGVCVTGSDFLETAHRERIRVRLNEFVTKRIITILNPLFRAVKAVADVPVLRGIMHELLEQGGIMPLPAAEYLTHKNAATLKKYGIISGSSTLYSTAAMRPQAMRLRALLLAVQTNQQLPPLPHAGAVSFKHSALPSETSAATLLLLSKIGWVRSGPLWIRLDIAEETRKRLHTLTRSGAKPIPADIASRLGSSRSALPSVLKGLSLRLKMPEILSENQIGPQAPVLLYSQKPAAAKRFPSPRKRKRVQNILPASGPFAALAVLQSRS